MSERPEHQSPGPARRRRRPDAHVAFAAVVAALAVLALVGWVTGNPILATFGSGRPALSLMTAVLLLVGAASARAMPGRLGAARLLGSVEAAAGCAIVLGHALGAPRLGPIPEAAWSSPITGCMFAASGVAAMLLSTTRVAAGQAVSFGLLLFAVLLGFGHVLPTAKLYAYLPGTGVAIPTSLAFASLAASQLVACRHSGIAGALSSRGAAGRPGMRLLLTGAVAIALAAFAALLALRAGLFDAETALALSAWCALGVLGATLWGLAVAIDRAEVAKRASDEENDRVRLTIAAAITHDLRSPLNTASLAAARLERSELEEPARAALVRLRHSHRRLDRLLRSMLDNLSVAGGRRIPLRISEFELGALAREVVAENAPALAGVVSVAGDARGWWDRDALFRVVENLLLNAVKYGVADGRIECRASQGADGAARLSVENRGAAIPKEEWEAIFEPFARGKEAEAAKSGWGVGLAFSRLVASEHGGALRVASSDAQGTVFELRLPRDARPIDRAATDAVRASETGGEP